MRKLMVGLGCLALSAVAAAANRPLDVPSRYVQYHLEHVLNADGTSYYDVQLTRKVLREKALESLKQHAISFSTSVERGEVLEAYTLKADGRRIEVPKNNYQLEINQGQEAGAPVFSDRTELSWVYPDLAVGDSVVAHYRVRQTEAIFPGHFSIGDDVSPYVAFDDMQVRIRYPKALAVQYRANHMQETRGEADGQAWVQWSYQNPQPVDDGRRDFSVSDPDQETGYAFSTFKTYGEIAAAYGVRALPKAQVTPRIQTLAAQLVGSETRPKEQARRLYEWVARNITYAGNCVGVGTVVPHDLDFVLDNKMGDCKDHATLLQALLAAQNIRSTQALVNASNVYTLPKIPLVSSVNHVINYLPEWNLYLDSTSDHTPFGMLPSGDRGKPVLHVEQYREGTQTPIPAMAGSTRIDNQLKIHPDGSVSGSVEFFMQGDVAVASRAAWRDLGPQEEERWLKSALKQVGLNADGVIEKDDPAALSDQFRIKLVVKKADKFLRLPGSGAFFIDPLWGASPIGRMTFTPDSEAKPVPVACSTARVEENYRIELPRSLKVLSVPGNLKARSALQRYEARYTLAKNVLVAHRLFEDNTPTVVCAPDTVAAYRQLGEQVSDNLKEQVLYK